MFAPDPHRLVNAPEPPPPPFAVVDAHVHLFPPRVFDAIWRWFTSHAWPIRYPFYVEEILTYLERQNVSHLFALHYSHKPEMARALNTYIADLARKESRIVPFGTVLPGEPDATEIVVEALDTLELVGLKLHCHVQKFAPDDPRAFPIYEAVAKRNKVIVLHAGREPSIGAYGFDCRGECGVDRVANVVERYPELKLIIPHLGHDQWREFLALARGSQNLYLDTSMAVGGYLTDSPTREDLLPVADKLLFGTDFPNLPYAWGHELEWLMGLELPAPILSNILGNTALDLVGRGKKAL